MTGLHRPHASRRPALSPITRSRAISFHSLILAAPSAISTSGLVSYLQGLFGPLFLGIVGIVALFFLFTREIIRFVQFLVLAVAIAVIFYTPSIVQKLAQGIAERARRPLNLRPGRKESTPVDLPTYTSIWRIEKRLYKLYDFRLPMPVPVGQIAVFAAITVPYVILLTVLGVPFDHTLFWLYVLPPGVLTWLATRPVLESKRLPELVLSQARYLGEPGTWCRMNPLAEKDDVVVVGKVWRRAEKPELAPAPARRPARQPVPAQARSTATRRPAAAPARAARGTLEAPAARPAAFGQPGPAGRAAARPPAAPGAPGRTQRRVRVPESTRAARQVWEQARATAAPPAVPAPPAPRGWPGPAIAPAPGAGAGAAAPPVPRAPGESAPARPAHRPPEIAHDSERAEPRPAAAPRIPARPRWPEASPEPTPGEAAPAPPETGRARGEAAPAGLTKPPEATAAPVEATAVPAEAPPGGAHPARPGARAAAP